MSKIIDKNYQKQKKSIKKLFILKLIIFFICVGVFTIITGPFVLFYGPFNNVKRQIVGTANQTFTHRYIVKLFLSDKKINEILGDNSNQPVSKVTENLNAITVKKVKENTIESYEITGDEHTFIKGYAIVIEDSSKVKVGYTSMLNHQGETTSQMAREHKAVVAINGGGFTDKSADGRLYAGTGGTPTGIVISNGNIIYNDLKDDNDKVCIMGLDSEGKLRVGDFSIKDMKEKNIKEAIAFGPALVVNGKPQKVEPGLNPRTCIGQTADGHIVFLVLDGSRNSITKLGASYEDEENILINQFHVLNAVNLDGGASTTMYYKGKVINNPATSLAERTIATSVYVEP